MNALRRLREHDAARRVLIPAYRAYGRAMMFGHGPRVLANGMPKAGTHLLSSLLAALPGLMFSGRHYVLGDFTSSASQKEVDEHRLERTLSSVNKGQFITAHFPPNSRLISVLERLQYKTIVIFRDPRDVVVSNAFYIAGLRRHFMHGRFSAEFDSIADRVMACIVGVPPDRQGKGLESIGHRVSRQPLWYEARDTYVCRFEHLVGPRGGGSTEAQLREGEHISRHLGLQLSSEQLRTVTRRAWSAKSATFRTGKIGAWREYFTDEHKAAFKGAAGQALIDMGYEKDLDW